MCYTNKRVLHWLALTEHQQFKLNVKPNQKVIVPVIVLDDVANGPDGSQVFIIALRIDVMQGGGGPGIPVGASKINSNLYVG